MHTHTRTLIHTRTRLHTDCITRHALCSNFDAEGYPLNMAVSMGSERICQLLIDYHSTRVRRMINLVNASFGAGSIEIRGSLFTQQELLDTNDSPLGVQGVPKFTGGLLFSKGQVEDFGREMLEWMKAPDTDGGGGGFDVGDLPKIMVIENEYLSLLKSEFVNRYNFRARKRVCVVWVGGGRGMGVGSSIPVLGMHTYIHIDILVSAGLCAWVLARRSIRSFGGMEDCLEHSAPFARVTAKT